MPHWPEFFGRIADTATRLGVDVFVVGGFVRDDVLRRDGGDEADLMVLSDGIAFATEVAKDLGKNARLTTFKNFGTAQVLWQGMRAEIVGARKESYRAESRNPQVEVGTFEEDMQRRDFTINALSVDIKKLPRVEIIDPFGGLQDLEDKILRTPLDPEITFSDDPLRMLRAARFASQLNFSIVPEAFAAMKNQASRIEILSIERVTEELNKIISSDNPSLGLRILFDAGILQLLLPELTALQGVKTIGKQSHKDNFYHTLQVLDNICLSTDKLYLRWAALMHDIGKAPTQKFDNVLGWTFHGHEVVGERMVPKIFKRLKLPQDERMRYVQKLVLLHLRPIALTHDVSDSAIRRLIVDAGDDLEDLMKLCMADITSKNLEKKHRFIEQFKAVMAKVEEVEEKDHLRNWKPPITGEIIMGTFNLKPSRLVGAIKEAVMEAILDGEIPNEYEPAYACMLKIAEKHNLYPSA